MRDARSRTIAWRIGVESSTTTRDTVKILTGNEVIEKELSLASDQEPTPVPVSYRRPGPGFLDRALHPREPGFGKASSVRAVLIQYPENPAGSIGWGGGWPWWAIFFLVSIAAAFLAQPILGVKF